MGPYHQASWDLAEGGLWSSNYGIPAGSAVKERKIHLHPTFGPLVEYHLGEVLAGTGRNTPTPLPQNAFGTRRPGQKTPAGAYVAFLRKNKHTKNTNIELDFFMYFAAVLLVFNVFGVWFLLFCHTKTMSYLLPVTIFSTWPKQGSDMVPSWNTKQKKITKFKKWKLSIIWNYLADLKTPDFAI